MCRVSLEYLKVLTLHIVINVNFSQLSIQINIINKKNIILKLNVKK